MPSRNDQPIFSAQDDLIGRVELASHLAQEMRAIDASDGYVVAINGPWGTGKTSLINLIREQLSTDPALQILDFNPWMFSGAQQLVDAFFQELAAQLRLKGERFNQIADRAESYGRLLSPLSLMPFVGAWIGRGRDVVQDLVDYQHSRRGGIGELRSELTAELRTLERPLVVVLDDIDRLETGEIRDIFRLVRLTASFPNVIYLVAFDRRRVIAALDDTGFDGRAYLDKIIQLPIDIPGLSPGQLWAQLGPALDAALADLDIPERFNSAAWPDVLAEIVLPLMDNLRDVRRYAAASRATCRAIGGQVELVDILALEALRVFRPHSFDLLVEAREVLTTTGQPWGRGGENAEHRVLVETYLASDPRNSAVLRAVVTRLFPAASRYMGGGHHGSDWLKTWIRSRRVAHPDVLALYLDRVLTEGMQSHAAAENVFAAMSDADALSTRLSQLGADALSSVLASLEAYEDDFPEESVVPACVALLNRLPELSGDATGMFSIDPRTQVVRVVLRLMKRVPSQTAAVDVVEQVLPCVRTLGAQVELLKILQYGETDEERLAPTDEGIRLARELVHRIETADAETILNEYDPLRVVLAPKHLLEQPLRRLDPTDSRLACHLLLNSRSDARSQTVGSRSVHRSGRLPWDLLIDIFGGEQGLAVAVGHLRDRAGESQELDDLLELAERYLSGWRPPEF